MFQLNFDKKALEQFNKLDKTIKERIWNKLQESKENPSHFFEHLIDIDAYKLRIGDYRVIVDIDNNKGIIRVLKVGHRKNVYEH